MWWHKKVSVCQLEGPLLQLTAPWPFHKFPFYHLQSWLIQIFPKLLMLKLHLSIQSFAWLCGCQHAASWRDLFPKKTVKHLPVLQLVSGFSSLGSCWKQPESNCQLCLSLCRRHHWGFTRALQHKATQSKVKAIKRTTRTTWTAALPHIIIPFFPQII